jgi:hypothetical protein
MSTSKTRETIARAYAALERASDESSDASSLLRRATDAAIDGEKTHRRHGPSSRYRESVETAARYFVCKWFLAPGKVKSARDATSMRLDCLYASALHDVLLDRMGRDFPALQKALDPAAAVDYCRDIVGGL